MKGRNFIKRLLLWGLLLVALSACERKAEEPAATLLQIDGRVVSLAQFLGEFAKTLPQGQALPDEQRLELKRSFLVQLIDRELALGEAERLHVQLLPEELEEVVQESRRDYPDGAFEQMLSQRGLSIEQWRHKLEQNLLMEKVVRETVYARVSVLEEEVSAYFQAHGEEFNRPEQVRARQILVATEEEGQSLLEQLRQGEEFAALARQHSLSPDSEQGGDLGFFARGQMPPEFDATVFALAAGQLSELVKSDYGYHIFFVEEHRKAVNLPLEAVAEDIRRTLQAQKEEQAYHAWLQELRSRATIVVDWELLQ